MNLFKMPLSFFFRISNCLHFGYCYSLFIFFFIIIIMMVCRSEETDVYKWKVSSLNDPFFGLSQMLRLQMLNIYTKTVAMMGEALDRTSKIFFPCIPFVAHNVCAHK